MSSTACEGTIKVSDVKLVAAAVVVVVVVYKIHVKGRKEYRDWCKIKVQIIN